MVYFGDKIKALRLEKGLSQQQLANKLELVRGTISAYEQSTKYPSVEALIKLCDFFNVSADYLLGLSDNKKIIMSELSDKQMQLVMGLIMELEQYNNLKEEN
jgi:transcriptional regulator with XRE-family HTH domain